MTNSKQLSGNDVVLRDHLRRQKLGTKDIEHLTNKDTSKEEARLKLIDEVSEIGAENRRKAELAGAKQRAKVEKAAAKAAVDKANEAEEQAEAKANEVEEISRVQKLEAQVKELESQLKKVA